MTQIVCCPEAKRIMCWVGILLPLILLDVGVKAQFPTVCVKNATREDATCCPIPPGFSEPCGGEPRGECSYHLDNNEDYFRAAPETEYDDRFHWPLRFFIFGCECMGNFAGYMCHECVYGYTGENCSEKIVRVRRNFRSLNSSEKSYIMDLFEKARSTQSDYSLIDTSKGADPVENVSFLNASVYDFLAYVHYYASRKTIFPPDRYPGNQTDFKCDTPNFISLDFAHHGTNFPIWHRYYMILWEKEMQKISGNIYFTFPYWNWTDAGTTCEICTEDFVGAQDIFGEISKNSRIHNWYGLCMRETGKCEECNPRKRYKITRSPGGVKNAPLLPTSATVNFALSQNVFDYPDFGASVPNSSFRGCLEGYAGIPMKDVYKLHNEVHMFFGGLLNSATSASWDPIFYFHHSFMDKLLEIWLRRTGAQVTQLPLTGAMPGHHRNSRLMAFYPLQESFLYFRSSINLGYTYDDMLDSHENSDFGQNMEQDDLQKNNNVEITATTKTPSNKDEVKLKTETYDGSKNTKDELVSKSWLLRVVVVETALLVVLLLILISACAQTLSRKQELYERVPSEDSFDMDLNSSAPTSRRHTPDIDNFSDKELDNLIG